MPTIKGTQRGVQRNQQTSPAHVIAEQDDEPRTVLLVHTDQDAQHLEHVDQKGTQREISSPGKPAKLMLLPRRRARPQTGSITVRLFHTGRGQEEGIQREV